MKLRIRDNSLRLRLTRGEVDALIREGKVLAHVRFSPEDRLLYALAQAPDATRVSARFAQGELLVVVPSPMARSWAASEEVGMEAEQAIGAEGVLRILIEKDFACLKPREGEDDLDAFPHPKAK